MKRIAVLAASAAMLGGVDANADWIEQQTFEDGCAMRSAWVDNDNTTLTNVTFSPPANCCGNVFNASSTDTKVLNLDGEYTRSYTGANNELDSGPYFDNTSGKPTTIEMMVEVTSPSASPAALTGADANARLAIATDVADGDGNCPFLLWCCPLDGSDAASTPSWVSLGRSFPTGSWVRVSIRIDWSANSGHSRCLVCLNGDPCGTAYGFIGPWAAAFNDSDIKRDDQNQEIYRVDKTQAAWYKLANAPGSTEAAATAGITNITLRGKAMFDDVLVATDCGITFHGTNPNGADITGPALAERQWRLSYGFPQTMSDSAHLDTSDLTIHQKWNLGIDPTNGEGFLGSLVAQNGSATTATLRFNGIAAPLDTATEYQVMRSYDKGQNWTKCTAAGGNYEISRPEGTPPTYGNTAYRLGNSTEVELATDQNRTVYYKVVVGDKAQ